MKRATAEIVREYGPFPGVDKVHGVSYDGQQIWFATGDKLHALDPASGKLRRSIDVPAHAGTAFDGQHLWAEGTLWVGVYRDRKIIQIDPDTGAILRTVESNRFVTGVTWVDGELWHATMESEQSELRHVDPRTGEVLEQLEMPPGAKVSGMESDGGDVFFCGDAAHSKVRAVRRPKRRTKTA